LRLSLDRNYDFTTQNDTGTKQTVKKAETYTTKIPVEYIVDPKTIEKTYADGILTYNIKFA
jgi:HSP20 family molecular chaperone IbpA